MLTHYLATYRDTLGEEETIIYNDGRTLHMTVRGVPFRGPDFETFGPLETPDLGMVSPFMLWEDTLCD